MKDDDKFIDLEHKIRGLAKQMSKKVEAEREGEDEAYWEAMANFIRLQNRPEPFANFLVEKLKKIYNSIDDIHVKSSLYNLAKDFEKSLKEWQDELEAAYQSGLRHGYSNGMAVYSVSDLLDELESREGVERTLLSDSHVKVVHGPARILVVFD
ncbi:hypothetical protein P8825_15270 [Shouchella clausii]|uniref:hypothetical protein n=1 Tax=Shouchella clausii TaxID=79880 RepID=UPI002DB762A6|nr:hypothetical protein [Shouchella clausii]MEB5480925.1 hypothetical protein [Shouchella clausii]